MKHDRNGWYDQQNELTIWNQEQHKQNKQVKLKKGKIERREELEEQSD